MRVCPAHAGRMDDRSQIITRSTSSCKEEFTTASAPATCLTPSSASDWTHLSRHETHATHCLLSLWHYFFRTLSRLTLPCLLLSFYYFYSLTLSPTLSFLLFLYLSVAAARRVESLTVTPGSTHHTRQRMEWGEKLELGVKKSEKQTLHNVIVYETYVLPQLVFSPI